MENRLRHYIPGEWFSVERLLEGEISIDLEVLLGLLPAYVQKLRQWRHDLPASRWFLLQLSQPLGRAHRETISES